MFVKICGTTTLEDAQLAVDAGADALGFIFAPSKRRISAEQVAAIGRLMPESVERVGVFTEPVLWELVQTVREAGLTAVQMHWPYHRGMVDLLRHALGGEVALWQVVGYQVEAADVGTAERAFADALARAMSDERISVVVLDSVVGKRSGGTGVAFPWSRAAELIAEVHAELARDAGRSRELPKLVLAGGLRAANVRSALAALQPWGIDVVSGVEASPGRKNPKLLARFMRAAQSGGSEPAPL